ncbi:MAG TPA: S41 family peptidase [Chitinophagaceae bacterium]|nr:S41 family peptidase [Chitinophagaceae bacterium]
MKKNHSILHLSVVALIAIVTFITPKVSGQDTLPAFIPSSCIGQPLIKMSKKEMLAQTIPATKPNPAISKEDQFKLFNNLVNIINETYVYPDFRGLDWAAIVASVRSKVEAGMETEKFYTEMEQFIQKLEDKHSSFQSPDKVAAVKAQLAGENKFVGVGAMFQPMLESNHLTVLAVYPGSPAEKGGIKQHDILLSVDDLPMMENNKLNPYTRGPECSIATLTVQSPGKDPRIVKVVRTAFSVPSPVYARLVPTTDGRRIGYIFLPTFLDLTIPNQVKKALEDFGQLDGLILDNRMNGGGSSLVLNPLLSYFTSGILGHFISRTSERQLEIVAAPVNNSQTVPLVILISKYTVSYGEVFAGALQNISRAKLVGQNTSGRVETLYGYNFPDGSRAWIAKERFDPIGTHSNWQGTGVQPDVESIKDWDQFTFENDPAIAIALKLLPPEQ